MTQPVQGPDGKLYQFPEGTNKDVAIRFFKSKGIGARPSLTPPSVPRPTVNMEGAEPNWYSKVMDRIGDNAEAIAQTPASVMNKSRQNYKEAQAKGDVPRMITAPLSAIGEAEMGSLKSLLGMTGPGILNRIRKGEDSANIMGDAATTFATSFGLPEGNEPIIKTGVGDIAKEITDAVNPPPKQMAAFQKGIGEHLDKISTFAKANGIDMRSLSGLSKAIQGSGEWIKDHYYKEILGPVNGKSVPIAGRIKGYGGETFSPSTATLGQLDARLSQVNAELDPKFSKGGIAGAAAVKSATELNAEAAGIRKVLYDELAKATGLDPKVVADTRGAFGALRGLAEKTETAASRERFAANKAERGPITVNPFSSGKHFVADKVINKLRGDVVGKKMSGALAKSRLPKYELPTPKRTATAPVKTRTPIRGESTTVGSIERSRPGDIEAVPEKLNARRERNAARRSDADLEKANQELQKIIKLSRHPFWKGEQ